MVVAWTVRCRAAAYPFFYIKPGEEPNDRIVKKFNKNNVPMRHFHPIGTFIENNRDCNTVVGKMKKMQQNESSNCPRMQVTLQL